MKQFSRYQELRSLIFVMGLILGGFLLVQAGLDYNEGISFSLERAIWFPFFAWYSGALFVAHYLLSRYAAKADQLILPTAGLLGGISLILMFRLPITYWDISSESWMSATRSLWHVERQMIFLIASFALMTLITIVSPRVIRYLRQYPVLSIFMGISLLLITAFFGVSSGVNGPRVSLNLGFFQFQPSELIKLLFVFFLAGYLHRIHSDAKEFNYVWGIPIPRFLIYAHPMLVVLGGALVALLVMSDLGVTLILLGIFPAMVFVSLSRRVFRFLVGAGTVILLLVLFIVGHLYNSFNEQLLPKLEVGQEQIGQLLDDDSDGVQGRIIDSIDRVQQRVDNFRDPLGACVNECPSYHTLQAIYAIAAGGIWGVGPGFGQLEYIPFVHTDMIYTAIVEELGLLGGLGILFLYWVLVRQGIKIALRQSSKESFNNLLAAGIVTALVLQIFIIVGGNLNLIPLTGITLPWLSYGGTSIIVNGLMLGLLMHLSKLSVGEPTAEAKYNIQQLKKVYQWMFVILMIGLIYGTVWMGPKLDPRVLSEGSWADNPVARQRRAVHLSHIERGVIRDRAGNVLAFNGGNGRIYNDISTAHIIGQSDGTGAGVSGVELAYNETLLGTDRYDLKTIWARMFQGNWRGSDLFLTIDPVWQQAVHDGLGGYDGAVVVMDVETGEILALVSHPLYDPNYSGGADLIDDGRYVNKVTQGLYPPGSTFKTVTAAVALKEGEIKKDHSFDYTDDLWYWDGYGSYCHERTVGHGVVTSCNSDLQQMSLSEAFAWSDNVAFAELAVGLGAKQFWEGGVDFGFNQTIPFELPTAVSTIAENQEWLENSAQLGMSGYGQSQLSVTPLQMMLVAASAANNGVIMEPHLLLQVQDPDGKVLDAGKARGWQRPLNRWDAAVLRDMMIQTVEDGWGSAAAVPGLIVGGKTGTAEWAESRNGRLPHSWFIGFAEMGDGRTVAFAVLVEAGGQGGAVAAPIAGYILRQMNLQLGMLP